MGLMQAVSGTLSGLSDQWLDAISAEGMGEGVVFVRGTHTRGHNRGTGDIISDGSRLLVYDRQALLVTDSGKIVDFSVEPGAYTFQTSSSPSLFSGNLGDALKETWERFKFGGAPSGQQKAFYVNMQEIKGIKFGTPNAVQYFDNFYNSELFLRCHGTYSIRISDPLKFYAEAIPRDAEHVHIDDIKEQYQAEFLEALQVSINQMSVDGIRISQITSKMSELSRYMRDTLDEEWLQRRGIEVEAVGIASVSYDEESRKLINMRNQGAMLSDPTVREGYVQSAVASGIEAAGSNPAGAGMAMMGVGMGMQAGGGFMAAASQSNQAQMAQQQTQMAQQQASQPAPQQAQMAQQQASQPAPAAPAQNGGGGFCPNCGTGQPAPRPNFCGNCGNKLG